MSIIRILPEAVANKIAAGEVVERPASIVKELIENSLDAGAKRVDLYVEGGGKRLLRVSDDGCGMTHDDALLAFERHATSKITSAEDLVEIATLGFRGEALPSVAAVSRITLQTRHASEAAGTQVELAGGKLRDVKEVAWPGGTCVEVRNLFFNTPARRKFLKSESTELGHIATLTTHYALAQPDKSFKLCSVTNEILNVSPVSAARERIYQLMGGKLLEQLVEIAPAERRMMALPVSGPEDEAEPETEPPVIRVSGFASRPEVQRLNRNNIYFFVNRRLVRDRLILHAISEAYRNILPSNMFPVVLVFLEMPPAEVDVNVHPAKTEVRFRNSGFIHDFVRDAVRGALLRTRPIAGFPVAKRAPIPEDEIAIEAAEVLSDEVPLMGAAPPTGPASSLTSSLAPQHSGSNAAFSSDRGSFRLSPSRPEPRPGILPLSEAESPGSRAMAVYAPASTATAIPPPEQPLTVAPVSSRAGQVAASGGQEFPADLRPLGQVQESFIIATNTEGLWLLDQHAAHERVLFERHLRQRREKAVEGQRLLLPIIVELKPEQQATFHEIAAELNANGIEAEPFGQRTVAVKTAPADIRAEEVDRLLLEILESVAGEERALSIQDLRLRIAASVACHAAIKVNMSLENTKMQWLVRELGNTECPMTCPHGRPTVLRYSLAEIQKAFRR